KSQQSKTSKCQCTSTSANGAAAVSVNGPNHSGGQSSQVFYSSSGEVLLSTAVIEIVNKTGRPENCRVLLDSAAQSNFITESLARKLQLKLEDVKVPIVGIGGKCAAQVKKQVTGTIKSRTTAFTATLEFLVMPVIIERLPSACLPTDLIAEPPNITLADPRFNEAAPIDALLGARLFWKLICVGQINIHPHKDLLLQKTQLGWVISGILETCPEATKKTTNAYHTNVDFNAFMAKFWELEELPSKPTLMTPEEMYCEEHFTRHVTRNQQGRFVVSLPFLETRQSLGDSAQIAKRRFFSIERKLIQNPELRAQYRQFMQDPTTIALTTTEQVQMFQNYSSIVKLKRIIAYCLRFIHNCKPQQQGYKSGPLQLEEVQDATPDVTQENVNSLTHWKKIQHMYQGFWNRWSKEYLSQLQQRAKWSKHYNQAELKVGQLVSIKENNLPPLLWKLGRIVQVHPGADATIRVVSIRTARGLQKVAVRNISIIPVQMDDSGSVSEVKVLNQC
ncbi:hypothetical protein PPYR_15082, partial [Photinus pyralis]